MYTSTGSVTRLTRRVLLVEQELPTFPKHLSLPPVLRGIRVTRYLVLYVCFVDRCLSFCPFSFGHCVVCPSSNYGLWLPLWYIQTLLIDERFLLQSQTRVHLNCEVANDVKYIKSFPFHHFGNRCHYFFMVKYIIYYIYHIQFSTRNDFLSFNHGCFCLWENIIVTTTP
jgi:hypothetical protein